MEITIKIELNEQNMKNFADIFWAPIIAKIDEENKTTEEATPVDVEPKAVEPEDNFAEKYKHFPKPEVRLVTPKNIEFADRMAELVKRNGGTDDEIRRASEFALTVHAEGCTHDDYVMAGEKYGMNELFIKYCHPTPKQGPSKPIKNWSEFPDMLRKRIEDSPLSFDKICEKANVRPQSLRYWMAGEHAPMTYNLYRLCSLFNWDKDYMLGLLENRAK